ncbi:MAG TPA: hypothetical protein VD864_03380, partial [Nocardioides sp.]|nr:hypothetical protein [Nocardioides sp.]
VQGAFMRRLGGGAAASAGYHDLGGCIDVRLWDLTPDQQTALNREVRLHGAAGWRRDQQHGGMDEHYHLVLGTDRPLAAGAEIQWDQYLAGRDGLATNGPDYMWRPTPLVTTPPERDWFDMATEEDLRKIVREEVAAQRDDIAKATAKAVMESPVIAKLDVNVRQALRDAVNESTKRAPGK